MVYVIISVIALVILLFIIKVVKTSPGNPRGFAMSVAKTQLISLSAIKEKYPNLSKEEQYLNALITRPGYSEETVQGIINSTKESAEKRGDVLRFNEVVRTLVMIEYLRRTGEKTRDFSRASEMMEGVLSVIPDEL
ncbi:MAG: hypothetical protein Q7J27_01760 [Syntrophales bacterium]|nr:hypothetical protein [Syntrophales bacterium]